MFESEQQKVFLPVAGTSSEDIGYKIRQARSDINNVLICHEISHDACSSLTKTEIDPYALLGALIEMQDILKLLDIESNQTKSVMNTTNQIVGDNLGYMKSKMNNHISYIHECVNCAHPLDVPDNHGVFHCKYCGSAYILGPTRVYSEY